MRLKHHDHAAVQAGACGGDDRGDLGGMVAVVVHHHDAARFTAQLKAPFGAAELLEPARNFGERHADFEPDGDGPERIHQVVASGHAQVQFAEIGRDLLVGGVQDSAARSECLERHPLGSHGGAAPFEPVGHDPARHPRHERPHRAVVDARHDGAVERHFVGEIDERLLQGVPAAVTFHVFVVDVRNHRNRGCQLQKRSIAFVRLDDHVIAAPEPRVAAEGAQAAADDGGRIQARPLEHQRHHRRGRGLAVRARDGDAVAEPHQLRQHLRARNHRDTPAPCLLDLRVAALDGGRGHDDVRILDVLRVVPARDPHAQPRQPGSHVRRLRVGPAHLVPEVREQFRDPAHAAPADADEVNAARAS